MKSSLYRLFEGHTCTPIHPRMHACVHEYAEYTKLKLILNLNEQQRLEAEEDISLEWKNTAG